MTRPDTIKDVLTEIIKIRQPMFFIGEWIPLEINQFNDFIEAIEAYKKGASTFLVASTDKTPDEPLFRARERLAQIEISKYDPLSYVEFLLRIYYPERVKQKEHINVRLDTSGVIIYSARVKDVAHKEGEIKEKTEWISLDYLSRLLCDIWEDTTEAINSLLTSYQRRILDIIYPGSTEEGIERMKTHVIILSDVTIFDKNLNEYSYKDFLDLLFSQDLSQYLIPELQQIVGWIDKDAIYLTEDALLVPGTAGLIIFTRNIKKYVKVAYAYLIVRCLQIIATYIYKRIQLIWDNISLIREHLRDIYEKKVLSLSDIFEIRSRLLDIRAQVDILRGIDYPINQSIEYIRKYIERNVKEGSEIKELLKAIGILETKDELTKIFGTIGRLLESLEEEIDGIISVAMTTVEKFMQEAAERQERFNTILSILAILTFAEALDILISDFAPAILPLQRGIITVSLIILAMLGLYIYHRL